MLVGADDAWARAGGGQGYHGSGSSNSGGFHSGGEGGGGNVDIGPLIYWGVQFFRYHPIVSLLLLAVVIYLLAKGSQQGADRYRTSVIRRAVGETAELQRAEALRRLASTDAAFDEGNFCRRAEQAFLRLQQAWSAQDLAGVRPFVSDGIFERFTLQIAEQKDFNYRNQVDRVQVAEVRLVQVAGDSIFDLLTVGIRARADDYRVALDTGKRLGEGTRATNSSSTGPFCARRGVTTGDKPGLVEGQCPNCGAEIELNESARCAPAAAWSAAAISIGCWLKSPKAPNGTTMRRANRPAWPPFARQRDPGLSVEHLEDRTSVIFWRKAMADRLGDVQPLLKMALPRISADYPRRWGPDKALRRYWGDAAVGSVETLGILPGEAAIGRWSKCAGPAARLSPRWDKRPSRPARTPCFVRSMCWFAGPASSRTWPRPSPRRHCPSCGTPRAIWPPMPASSAA